MKLKVARVACKMTQKELSEKSGVSRNLISKAENGDFSSISYKKMEMLSKTLGVTTKELFFD